MCYNWAESGWNGRKVPFMYRIIDSFPWFMRVSESELIEKFIRTIHVDPSNTKRLFTVGFAGLNGVGKSFVARRLSEKLGLYVASNDKIRRFLNEQGFEGASPVQDMVQKIGPASSAYLYEHKISHVIDADLYQLHQITRENARNHGANFFLVRLVCPEEIILERLERREREIRGNADANLSRVGKDEYFKRKRLHESLPIPETFFTIDTSGDIDSQLDLLVSKLQAENVL